MDRDELIKLAELRLADAEALIAAGRWAGAYYLLGYTIECALKACISKQFLLHNVPEKSLIEKFYTHKLDNLLAISGIRAEFERQAKRDPVFGINWNTVKDWSEAKRYEIILPEALARGMYDAVNNDSSGILPWLRTHY